MSKMSDFAAELQALGIVPEQLEADAGLCVCGGAACIVSVEEECGNAVIMYACRECPNQWMHCVKAANE